MRTNDVAAAIHAHMCVDPRFGYTQGDGRWGTGSHAIEALSIGGKLYGLPVGDYDCSSSAIEAWRLALEGTRFEGALDAATYTGDMRSVFCGSGLFEWRPMSFLAEPGDLYLNEASHVAMCQTQFPDVLSEFLINEHGGIVGGQMGDQTGGESMVRDYWVPSFGWDGILHYNGKADQLNVRRVIQYPSNLTDAQRWRIVPAGEYVTIRDSTGNCLDVYQGSTKPMGDGRIVITFEPNGTDAQMWKLDSGENGAVMLRSKLDESYVLEAQGGAMGQAYAQMWHEQAEPMNRWAQQWYVHPAWDGGGSIVVNAKSLMALDSNPHGIVL